MSAPAGATKAWAFNLIASRARNVGHHAIDAAYVAAMWEARQINSPCARGTVDSYIRDQFAQFRATIEGLPDA